MSRSKTAFYTRLAIGTLISALALQAQSYYGSIRGTLVDQNGGVLAAGKISLINTGTAEQRSTITSGSGEFVFNEVVPGTYSAVSYTHLTLPTILRV